ncbi:MAG TPA: hypothetical protein VL053_07940 [Arachidicoccus sp.]|nr:hypothetical protein [Arachidicoccus sp.]
MKKAICALMLALTMSIGVQTAMAANAGPRDRNAKKELTTEQQAQFDKIVERVNEIKEMDKSNLTRSEKKALRSELKDMKSEARAMNGGVYLSVGAIIIIILVLILIL